RRGLERRGRADGVAVEPDRILDGADELDVLGGVALPELVDRRSPALAPDVLMLEQNREPLGALRMPSGRVQTRERAMRQDVDRTSFGVTTRRPGAMVECETRTQGAGIATLFPRPRTQDRADRRGRSARGSLRREL